MPGVIVKSSYMTNRTHIVRYMRYIATREGVEHLTASVRQRPATARQQTYIAEHQEDMQKLGEYPSYQRIGTIDAASKLITAYSEHIVMSSTNYREYARAARESPGGDPNRPATDKQRDFITRHHTEAEGLPEYEDFQKNPSVGNASALIGMIAEQNPADPEIYLRYIAERPGVETDGAEHGLFDLRGKADLAAECEKVLESKSVVWAHIISLRREDAARLDVDSAEAWRKYLAAEAPRIAKLYHISPVNLRMLGAFHNEGHHPHIHVLVYSDDPTEGTITKEQMQQAGKKMRSMFTNSIFREDLAQVKVKKTQARDDMNRRLQGYTNALYGKKVKIAPEITAAVCSLAHVLPTTGKKQYAYFPKNLKQQVNEVLRLIVQKDPTMGKLVETYFSCERNMIGLYHDDPKAMENKIAEVVDRFFTPRTGQYEKVTDRTALHNCIIRWAYAIRAKQFSPGETQPAAEKPVKPQPEALPVETKTEQGKSRPSRAVQKRQKTAFEKLQHKADHGDANAQYRLARMFRDGIGVPESAFHADEYFYKAYQNYRYEADIQQSPFANYRLGVMYQHGEGCFQDDGKALECFEEAANLGHVQSMFLAGRILTDETKAVSSVADFDKGCDYLETAAENGHKGALYTLGKLYLGIEDEEYKSAGMELLHKAAAQGYLPASQLLREAEHANEKQQKPLQPVEPEALPIVQGQAPSDKTVTDEKEMAAASPPAIEKPEVLPVSDEPVGQPLSDEENEQTEPPEKAEGFPVNSEPEIDASGGDIFTDDQIPFAAGAAEQEDTAVSSRQEESREPAGSGTQYLVLLMLRELAGNIEAQCNTDHAYSRIRRHSRIHRRHKRQERYEQEAPYER